MEQDLRSVHVLQPFVQVLVLLPEPQPVEVLHPLHLPQEVERGTQAGVGVAVGRGVGVGVGIAVGVGEGVGVGVMVSDDVPESPEPVIVYVLPGIASNCAVKMIVVQA